MNNQNRFLDSSIPGESPEVFLPNLYQEGKIIHKGIFSPDYENFYYTESKTDFTNFNIKQLNKVDNKWSEPKEAFFNSKFEDHGMSFSPDGQTLYFSSTRPTNREGIPDTWHIWVSKKIKNQWSEPEFVNIPNMKRKLVSHPTISKEGTLYFHASNLDYSEMNIYSAEQINGEFQNATLLDFEKDQNSQKCTPFISSNGDYIIFAEIGEKDLQLKISFMNKNREWTAPEGLSELINTGGQGNPFVTKDNKFLFFTKVDINGIWNVNWVNIEKELKTIVRAGIAPLFSDKIW